MATNGLRRLLLRSLPALLFLLLSLVAAPQRSTAPQQPVARAVLAATDASPEQAEVTPAACDAPPVPADRATVLFAQFTAGVRGCRAPPAASV